MLCCACLSWGRPGFNPWVGKIPWRRARQPTPVFLPGESQGQRSLAGYGPWGCKESDMTSQPRDRTQVSHIAGRFFTIWAIREAQDSFSRESSWPGNRTRVSCIAGGFFTGWATREAQRGRGSGINWRLGLTCTHYCIKNNECCDSWGRKESDTTEQLNWTELKGLLFSTGNSLLCNGQ